MDIFTEDHCHQWSTALHLSPTIALILASTSTTARVILSLKREVQDQWEEPLISQYFPSRGGDGCAERDTARSRRCESSIVHREHGPSTLRGRTTGPPPQQASNSPHSGLDIWRTAEGGIASCAYHSSTLVQSCAACEFQISAGEIRNYNLD